ncbi:hypothetical protein BFG60_1560 [Microcystis aeruginosa NIES-98]|nr:hypothetical protein BFG60_1560 [Microcystis aeruginosa NIES-98]
MNGKPFLSIFGLDSYFDGTLYSLEKLIEWKLPSLVGLIHESTLLSLY